MGDHDSEFPSQPGPSERDSDAHCFSSGAVRESANKSAASAASPDYIKFQAVIKLAAPAASLRGGRASGRLDHGVFSQSLAALADPVQSLVALKFRFHPGWRFMFCRTAVGFRLALSTKLHITCEETYTM